MSAKTWSWNPEVDHERDFVGFGEHGFKGSWGPKDARVAISFVINYEEASPIEHSDSQLV
jgi:hypothetical protein